MPTFCLVLTGHLIDGQALPEREDALAAAFGMNSDAFREGVWQRAPLIVRQALSENEATAQADQLRSVGAQVDVLPEKQPLLWLLRGERVLGPLPDGALALFAQVGDRWCADGSSQWREVSIESGTAPPPLPIARSLATPRSSTTPPPLTRSSRTSSRRWRPLLWLALVVVVLLAGFVWVFRAATPRPGPVQAQLYVARPLQPLNPSLQRASSTRCRAPTVANASEEDRFLMTGGERQPTGVSQRNGAVYVTEAIVGFDAQCQPDAVQLYAFRSGVLIGTLLDSPWDPARTRLDNLQLGDDGVAHFTLTQCNPSSGQCTAPVRYSARVQADTAGLTLTAEHLGSGIEILSRPPPKYPAVAIRQRHQGTVMLLITVDGSGAAQNIALEQSSGYAELDEAALEAARHWRFKTTPAANGGAAPTMRARVPVRFDLDQPKRQ